jgi:TATA box binding protein associated factor (TAF)
MRHGKRNVLTTEDINNALRLRNVDVRQPPQHRVGWTSLAARSFTGAADL